MTYLFRKVVALFSFLSPSPLSFLCSVSQMSRIYCDIKNYKNYWNPGPPFLECQNCHPGPHGGIILVRGDLVGLRDIESARDAENAAKVLETTTLSAETPAFVPFNTPRSLRHSISHQALPLNPQVHFTLPPTRSFSGGSSSLGLPSHHVHQPENFISPCPGVHLGLLGSFSTENERSCSHPDNVPLLHRLDRPSGSVRHPYHAYNQPAGIHPTAAFNPPYAIRPPPRVTSIAGLHTAPEFNTPATIPPAAAFNPPAGIHQPPEIDPMTGLNVTLGFNTPARIPPAFNSPSGIYPPPEVAPSTGLNRPPVFNTPTRIPPTGALPTPPGVTPLVGIAPTGPFTPPELTSPSECPDPGQYPALGHPRAGPGSKMWHHQSG